jgi:phosphoglycolate phosphatase-like HAD superfamily hydrolase
MARARGYSPYESSTQQDALLDSIVETASSSGAGGVGVFDLDGCLFDTRSRQVHIFREFASRTGALDLYCVEAVHFKDWDLGNTLRNAGLPEARIDAVLDGLKAFWFERFFTSRYVQFDHAMPGAVELVNRCRATGLKIVYLTGRDETMRAGTEASLKGFGFPIDGDECRLIVKPDFETDDTEFKDAALKTIAAMAQPVIFLDNEPANVNKFHERYPDAQVVFVETDHSPRPDEPHSSLPWLRSFSRTDS